MLCPDYRRQVRDNLVGYVTGLAPRRDALLEVDHVVAHGGDDAHVAYVAMAGHYDCRPPGLELSENARPVRSIDIGVVRREPREDREDALLGEITGEEDAFCGKPHDLVALGVSLAEVTKLDRAAAEVDRPAVAVI